MGKFARMAVLCQLAAAHLVRALIAVRSNLVQLRTNLSIHLRGVLKTFGLFVGTVGKGAFESRVRELAICADPGENHDAGSSLKKWAE